MTKPKTVPPRCCFMRYLSNQLGTELKVCPASLNQLGTELKVCPASYYLHFLRGTYAQHGQAILQHLRHGGNQCQASLLDNFVFYQNTLGIVIAVITGSELTQIKRDVMRGKICCRCCEHLWVFCQQ